MSDLNITYLVCNRICIFYLQFPFLFEVSGNSFCCWSFWAAGRICVLNTERTTLSHITNANLTASVFAHSRCSSFATPAVKCCSVLRNFRFYAFTLFQCVFKAFCFCGYPFLNEFSKTSALCYLVRLSVNILTKTDVFLFVFSTKMA